MSGKGIALTPEQAEKFKDGCRQILQSVEADGTEAAAKFIADLERLATRVERDRWVPAWLMERFVWWATQAGQVALAADRVIELIKDLG